MKFKEEVNLKDWRYIYGSLTKIYTINEIAKLFKLHPYTVRRLAREHKIPAFKFGGQWRFDKKEISQWIKKLLI